MASPLFRFKKFSLSQEGTTHRVGTDSVLLGAWAKAEGATRILDIGAGTGVVALMLAQRTENRPGTLITAVEIDPESARCAASNFAASPWARRLYLVESAVQQFAQTAAYQFDLIVSNPPFYVEALESPDAKRRLGRHAASLPQVDLLQAAGRLLAPGGSFCVILPVAEGRRLRELAVLNGLFCNAEMHVSGRSGKPVERLLMRFTRDPRPFRRHEMSIYGVEEMYSADFQALTREFYPSF